MDWNHLPVGRTRHGIRSRITIVGLIACAVIVGSFTVGQQRALASTGMQNSVDDTTTPCLILGVDFHGNVCPSDSPTGGAALSVSPAPALINYLEKFSGSIPATVTTTLPQCGTKHSDGTRYCFPASYNDPRASHVITWHPSGYQVEFYGGPPTACVTDKTCTAVIPITYTVCPTTCPVSATHTYTQAATVNPTLSVNWTGTLPFSLQEPQNNPVPYDCGYGGSQVLPSPPIFIPPGVDCVGTNTYTGAYDTPIQTTVATPNGPSGNYVVGTNWTNGAYTPPVAARSNSGDHENYQTTCLNRFSPSNCGLQFVPLARGGACTPASGNNCENSSACTTIPNPPIYGGYCGAYSGGTNGSGAWGSFSNVDEIPGPIGYTYAPTAISDCAHRNICNSSNYGVSDGGTPPSRCTGRTIFTKLDPGVTGNINCGIYVMSEQGSIKQIIYYYPQPGATTCTYCVQALVNGPLSNGYTLSNGPLEPNYTTVANAVGQPSYAPESFVTQGTQYVSGFDYPITCQPPDLTGTGCFPNFAPSPTYYKLSPCPSCYPQMGLIQNQGVATNTPATAYTDYNTIANTSTNYTTTVPDGPVLDAGYLPETDPRVGGSGTPLTTIQGSSGILDANNQPTSYCRIQAPGAPLQCTLQTDIYYLPYAYWQPTKIGTSTYTLSTESLQSGTNGAPHIVAVQQPPITYYSQTTTSQNWTPLQEAQTQTPDEQVTPTRTSTFPLVVLQEEPVSG